MSLARVSFYVVKYFGVFLCASLMTGIAIAETAPRQPQWQEYTRTGPGVEAALYAQSRLPALGAAHVLSLSSSLPGLLTAEQRLELSLYGPWLTEDGLSNNAQQLIRLIQEAGIHGLNPEAYDLEQILHTVDTLTLLDKPDTHSDFITVGVLQPDAASLRESFSWQMSTAFSRLATHLGQGVVDARSTQNDLYRDVPAVHTPALLTRIERGQMSVKEAIDSITPSQPEYKRLTLRMRDLLTERASGVQRTRVHQTGDLTNAQLRDDIVILKHRLYESGDLPGSSYATPVYDLALVTALQKFQKRHGLPETGAFNKVTRRALNHDIDSDITELALSLERWRWMPRELGEKHIFVNIPDYRVEVRDGTSTVLSMVAVVGAVDHQTPAFSRDMSYLEFNPTWTVPSKIANAELIPKERRNPGYLASRQFIYLARVDNRLVQLPASEVTREDLRSSPFPYVLQQKGGPINALGRMKFMLPNPYAIYLHDTQAKKHFTLNDRAFSHGCIRLSDPDSLATLLMLQDGYGSSDVARALGSKETRRVRLRQPIPTHLTYLTTWVDSDGQLQRRADVYKHDAALRIALQASNTLITVLMRNGKQRLDDELLASSE